jgi:hypothetical protein
MRRFPRMKLERTAFKLDGARVSVGEVLTGCWIAGLLEPLKARVREGVTAASLAEATDAEIDVDALEQPLDEWRSERDLIAAEELEAWLDERELRIEDLCDHLEREILRRRAVTDADRAAHGPDREELLALLADEAALGGELDALVEAFARRCVAPVDAGSGEALDARRIRTRRELLSECGVADLDGLTEVAEAFETSRERLEWLVGVEVEFRLFRDEALSFSHVKAALEDLRDELVRYEIVSAECPTEDVARELLCCIRFDRDTFSRSVARAGLACHRRTVFTDDLSGVPFGHHLPSAQEREVFGPTELEGAHVVLQLLERHDPDLSTPGVPERISDRLIERAVKKPLSDRVRFPDPQAA